MIIKRKKKDIKLYNIPIIIEDAKGGDKYRIKLLNDYNELKKDRIYEANYKLIKFCSEDLWNKIKNKYSSSS